VKTKHIIAVALEGLQNTILELFEHVDTQLHMVDDIEEGYDLAAVVDCDIFFVNQFSIGFDPVDLVAEAERRLAKGSVPFVLFSGNSFKDVLLVFQDLKSSEFVIRKPTKSTLLHELEGLLLGQPLSLEDETESDLPDQLQSIGFNDTKEVDGKIYQVQTEVHPGDSQMDLRCLVYQGGTIVSAETVSIQNTDDNPIAAASAAAHKLHLEQLNKIE
jgi:hypothetical protein